MKGGFQKIIKISLYLLVFLIPLFWLPFSFEIYELNKTYLLFFLASFGFLVWGAKAVFKDKEIHFQLSSLDILILLFLLTALVSLIFSIDKNSSLFGFYGSFSNSLIGLFSFGMFYFLIRNNVRINKNKDSQDLITPELLLKIFLWSCFFVILITYFSIFGIWEKISIKYPLMLQRTFNPVSGSLEGLAIFISIIITLSVGLILCFNSKIKKTYLLILLFGALGLLVVIDFNSAWFVLSGSLGVFLIFSIFTRAFRKDVNKLLLPILLIIISTAFLFIDFKSDKQPQSFFFFQSERLLNQRVSWEIAFKTLKKSIKNTFFGSGIGTWYYTFLTERPAEFNNSVFWDIRFTNARNYISELLATTGILGMLSYILLVGVFFLTFWPLRKQKEILLYVATFLALLIGQFFYYQNTVLAFSFWFFIGLGSCVCQLPDRGQTIKKTLSFKRFPELSLIPSVLLVLFCAFFFTTYYLLIRFYLADVNYLKSNITSSIEERVGFLEKAINLNPGLVVYRTMSAKAYLIQALNELQEPLSDQDIRNIQAIVIKAINQAEKAAEISPNNVTTWETSGVVYREIGGMDDKARDAFKKATELETTNPVLHTELGKIYLKLNDIENAKNSFTTAIELKSDYFDALFQEALIYEKEGDLDRTLFKMEKLEEQYPLNAEIKFQLGRLYFNREELDKAISLFEWIIVMNPNHSNGFYYSGLVYERKGETEKAILAFERVLELNPGSQEVAQKLKELKGE